MKNKTTHNLKGCKCPKGSDKRFCLGNNGDEAIMVAIEVVKRERKEAVKKERKKIIKHLQAEGDTLPNVLPAHSYEEGYWDGLKFASQYINNL